MDFNRKDFLKTLGFSLFSGSVYLSNPLSMYGKSLSGELFFDISLAQWSLNKSFFNGKLDPLDFAKIARETFNIDAVEYVNQFFEDKARDQSYLKELKKRSEDYGVDNLLIMVDNEGDLGDPDTEKRKTAVENHFKWVEAAKYLGCHSIRVNAESSGSYREQMKQAADGLSQLCEFAESHEINVLVENHGGLSSNAEWLTGVMEKVDHPRAGTLPDFGNFEISDDKSYDRYKGVGELMPYAKAVSAKSYAFNENGDETTIDYLKMMKIVKQAGYSGYVGIEYEGDQLSEEEGIRMTKKLLKRVGKKLS